ncbi:hypothetical protein [Geoglobus acetivorans]|uniref:hypothetical protein n=1 Tax=Geoglobus acetivorans TaxID=565033 RepID=UPI0011DDB802
MSQKKSIAVVLLTLSLFAIFVLIQMDYFEPDPEIIGTEQESFRTISVWVKNKSPFSGDIVVMVYFYDKKPTSPTINPVAIKQEYVHIKGYELKKIKIQIPIEALYSRFYYKVQVAHVDFK